VDRWGLAACCLKHPEDGAREGAEFIKRHLIRVADRSFDEFAEGNASAARIGRMLGLDAVAG
jgi:hypothetical protein